jgi:cytochrome P450
MFFLLCIIPILIYLSYKFIYKPKQMYDYLKAQGIPTEPFRPIIGQLYQIRSYLQHNHIMNYFQSLQIKHGSIFLIALKSELRLIIHQPDYIREVLKIHKENYLKADFYKRTLSPIIGLHNLLVSEGEEHDRSRRMLNPVFHHVNLQSMIPIIIEQTKKAIHSWPNEGEFDVQEESSALSLSIIASAAFGQSFETIQNGRQITHEIFTDVLNAIQHRLFNPLLAIPFLSMLPIMKKPIIDKGRDKIHRFVDQIIHERKLGASQSYCQSSDILDLLLNAKDDKDQGFSDNQIRDEAIAFILAGHETTSSLITWCLYAIMTHPEVYRACVEEIDQVLQDGTELDYHKLNQLQIIEATIYETLRLYPPAPFFVRQCVREHVIGGRESKQPPISIPRGVLVHINTYVLHRLEEYWGMNAENFDYRRWLRNPETGIKPKLKHTFCYLPFSAGSRNCIGQQFALLESKVILAFLLKHFEFEMIEGQFIIPDFSITMKLAYGLRVKIKRRESFD